MCAYLKYTSRAGMNGQATSGQPPPFVHLHVHSNFSFLDGSSRIEELAKRAAELGHTALALTDHNGLYGAVRFAKACKRRGIRPIFGAEVETEPLAPKPLTPKPQGNHSSPSGDHPYHLLLLAENREGYANLCRLLSSAHLAVPERDRPPVVTRKDLRAHSGGIICLTGCRRGEVGHLLDAGREEEARNTLEELCALFNPHNVFVEIQHFGYEPKRDVGQRTNPGEGGRAPTISTPLPADHDTGFHEGGTPWALSCSAYCDRLLRLAHAAGLPPVFTTNAHYARPEGRDLDSCLAAHGGRRHGRPGADPAPPGARNGHWW